MVRIILFILTFFLAASASSQILRMSSNSSLGVKAGTPTYDTIQVNLWDSTSNIGKINTTGWNDWNIRANADGNLFSYMFNWTTGTNSGIQAAWRLNDKTGRAITAYVDNTAGYASSQTTNFPTSTFRSAGYTNGSDLTYLMFQGLDNSKTYRLELLGSRNSGTTLVATYSYGAASDNVTFNGNTSKVIILDNLTPSSGTIDVLIDYTTNTFAFINAFRLIQINP